jgi:hypothetical protein
VAPAILFGSCEYTRRRSIADFVERTTGLEVGIFGYLHDDADTHVAVRVRVSTESVAFWRESGVARLIVALPRGPLIPVARFDDGEGPADVQPPDPKPGLLWIQECTDTNAWYGLVDPEEEVLWLRVEYPDMGGDPPGCFDSLNWIVTEGD